ncbi:hypothetical protein [Streptacidiphilus fuscans]|uniref:Uncharacterized protein n=1 Tax=Streptacidiphilus fuscans TaxID=2789292 RepID=A0A931B1Y2_9ACTN|nr:hypothetical protein [Streptacidiphilus fuscans]MBF9068889.1 hypothetical protein [Streptacidiphilus fuscans]MBF9073343.1 hypothetical protein [Streptacidiphilus fuscans]
MTATTAKHPGKSAEEEVCVQFAGCRPEDAEAVMTALETAFPPEPTAGHVRPEGSRPASNVWSLLLDTGGRHGTHLAPVHLDGEVSADLIGAADSVHRVREALEEAVHVQDRGVVPGEHELELRLLLT